MHGQDQDANLRILLGRERDQLDAVFVAECQVDDDHVRLLLGESCLGFGDGLRFAGYLKARAGPEQFAQAFTEQRMIIDE